MKLIEKCRRFLLARATVLSLIALLTGMVTVGSLFPQRFNSTEMVLTKWRAANPVYAFLADYLGFHHVYSSPLFVLILSLFFLSLLLSTYDQLKRVWGKVISVSVQPVSDGIPVLQSSGVIQARARGKGYRKLSDDGHVIRLVRNPWSYYGNAFLHLGILLVVFAALFITLSQKRGRVNLAQGELFEPGETWELEEKGLAAGVFYLPHSVRVDRVQPDFWETDDLRQQRTIVTFLEPNNQSSTYELLINKTVYHQGIRVDQSASFGHSFLLVLQDGENRQFPLRLDMEHPLKRDKPSYNSFQFDGIPYLLQAKYFADREKQKMEGGTPLLILRLEQFGEVEGELTLTTGQVGELGPYQVSLVNTMQWTGLVFTDIQGMGVLFFGFFIIILGGWFTYGMPPREILIQKKNEGRECIVWWKPGRFGSFFETELGDIIQHD